MGSSELGGIATAVAPNLAPKSVTVTLTSTVQTSGEALPFRPWDLICYYPALSHNSNAGLSKQTCQMFPVHIRICI